MNIVKIFSLVIVLFSITHFVPGAILLTHAEIMEDLKLWLPSHLTKDDHTAIANIIETAQDEPIVASKEYQNRDFGFSYSGITSTALSSLKEIHDRAEKSASRIAAVDIGAGHGNMTWKMILAGANVDAIELQKPLAEALSKKTLIVKPYVKPLKIRDLVTVHHSDFFDAVSQGQLTNKYTNKYTEKYDVAWAGNFIHMLTPKEVDRFARQLFVMMKNGGKVFITAHTYSPGYQGDADLAGQSQVDLFYANKAKGLRFPGFMIRSSVSVTDQFFFFTVPMIVNISEKINGLSIDPSIGDSDSVISEFRPGAKIGETKGTLIQRRNNIGELKGDWKTFADRKYIDMSWAAHVNFDIRTVATSMKKVVHYFDADVLEKVFKEAGFTIHAVYYENNLGERVEPVLQKEDFMKTHYSVSLEATKGSN